MKDKLKQNNTVFETSKWVFILTQTKMWLKIIPQTKQIHYI